MKTQLPLRRSTKVDDYANNDPARQLGDAFPRTVSLLAVLNRKSPSLRDLLSRLAVPAPHRTPQNIMGVSLPLAPLHRYAEALDDKNLPETVQRSVAHRRIAYIGGRLCAELALEKLGASASAVGRDAFGAPCWPPGLIGSIAHTDAIASAVVGYRRHIGALGIDSEPLVNEQAAISIVEMCCTAAERKAWFPYGPEIRTATLLFSAKEALYKALHPTLRRFVDFTEVEIEFIDWTQRMLQLRPQSGSSLARQMRPVIANFEVKHDVMHATIAAAHEDLFAARASDDVATRPV